jgi:hypothetical protein
MLEEEEQISVNRETLRLWFGIFSVRISSGRL